MDMLRKINKGVGVAATAMIIAGVTPQIVHAIPNKDNMTKVEAKAICKDIEKSIKDGTFKGKDLNKNLHSNINEISKKDGVYEIKVKTLKENSDEPSMAGQYINSTVKHTEKKGKKYFTVTLKRMDWMKNVVISVDGKQPTVEKKENGNIGEFTFEVGSENSEVMMQMNVVPMGNAKVTFRIVPEATAISQVKPESKKEDTQAKDKQKDKEKENQKPKEDIKQTGEKDKNSKKDKTDKKSEMKWGKVSSVSEVNSIEFGQFYGGFDKYRVGFKAGTYNPEMEIYIKKFQKVIVNDIEYIKAVSVEQERTFYFSAMGLEINPSAFKEGENVLILKSNGFNDLKLIINKNGKYVKIISQQEAIDSSKGSDSAVKPQHNIADGTYTIGFKAYKADNPNETSMLGGFLDPNVKVDVKDGKIKLTFLHKVMAEMLIDLRVESNGVYVPAKLTYYQSPKGKTDNKMKTVEVEVSDLSNPHNCAVLVTGMNGKLIDVGHIDRYKVAKFIFDDKLVEGWKGFEEKRVVKTKEDTFNDALVSIHLDKDHDGIVTDEELALANYEIQLNSKHIKDISRLKNLGSKVIELDLRDNEISEITEGTFDNAVNLEKLLINCNQITKLPSNIFDKLTKLKILDISNNNLKTLPEGLFKNLKNLENLSIRECNLEELPDGIFKNLKNLKTLSLVGNKLSHIPKAIFNLDNLESLYVTENMLEEIPQELSNLKKLKAIYAEHNFINKIDTKFFDNIRKNNNVKTLNLRDNELKELPKDMDKMFDFNSFSNEVILNNVMDMPKFKDNAMKKSYPQKSFAEFKAEVSGNKITWKSDLSILDMLCWQRAVDKYSQDIKDVKEYKKYLESQGAKTAQDVLKKQGLMWDIQTDIQKKDVNGKYVTIKTFKSKEDNNSGSYEDVNIKEGTKYRVLKRVNGATYEVFSYLLGQMAEVQVVNENHSKEVVNNKIKDGVYSIEFTAYKVEDRNETSMLNNFFDKKAKLEVKDGKIKITLLNICFADGVYDFRIGSNGQFPESVAKGYGKLDYKGNYPFKTFEVNISDIDGEYEGCVLVGPMGGLKSDVGNFDKYRKVMFVFHRDNLKEWNGFNEDHKKTDVDKEFNKALLEAKLDKDGDNIITNEELALAEGEVKLPRKGIKDISRLQFLGKNVTSLDLTGNQITELQEGVFNNLTKLIKLDIHGNRIEKLPEGIFDNLKELEELHIGKNEFKELPKRIFDKLTKLKKLSIYSTSLNNIDDNLFNNLKKLEYLSLEGTGISKIPQGIFKLVNLKTLSLNNNNLQTIPKELANLKNLTWLDLGTNYIEEIPEEIYKNLNKLTTFEIKDNQLMKMPLNIWDLMPENKRLDCSFNKLVETPKLPDASKGKRWLTSYPQKQALNLKLNAKDGSVSWNQDISSLDIIAWWKIARASNTKKVPETLAEYKEQLGDKKPLEFLLKGGSEPQIITKIQKKDKDGNYITIKEITNYNEEDYSDKFKDTNMKDGDEYRILKRIGVISYGSETYVCTDVAYAKAIVTENTNLDYKEDTNKKAKVIDVNIKVLKAENDEESMSGAYLGKKARYVEENGKKYYEIDVLALDWMKNISIDVDGKKVQHTEKETGNTKVMGADHKGGTVRFEVPAIDSKITVHMYVVPMSANVTFRVVGDKNQSDIKSDVKPEKPVINIEKPSVYEAKVTVDVINKENEKAIKKYVDIQEKINVEVKDKQAYMTIKLKGKQKDIKGIKVNEKVVEFQVIGQELEKVKKFAAMNELIAPKVEENKESTTVRFKIPDEKAKVEIIMHDEVENKDVSFAIKLKEDTIQEIKDNSKPEIKPSTHTGTSHKHRKHKKHSKDDDAVKHSEQVKDDKDHKKDDATTTKDTNVKEDGNKDVKPNSDVKDNSKKDDNIKDNKDTKKDKENNNSSEKKDNEDSKDKTVEDKKDVSKEIKTENKKEQKQNKVTSQEKSSSTKSTESKPNKKATEIKEKKLPQTGMPFGSGLLATIGSAISGLGIVLGRKNRKNKK